MHMHLPIISILLETLRLSLRQFRSSQFVYSLLQSLETQTLNPLDLLSQDMNK